MSLNEGSLTDLDLGLARSKFLKRNFHEIVTDVVDGKQCTEAV